MKNVTIVGGGVLGTQIAMQCAYTGHNTTIWLRSESSIGRTKPKLEKVKQSYIDAINLMASDEGKNTKNWCFGIADMDNFSKDDCLKKVEDAYESLKIELDLKKALKDADIIIESMSENFDAKKEMYEKMYDLVPEKAIVVTNSSTFLPSKFRKYQKDPTKYLALHFANAIWKNNTAEVMMHSTTNEKYFNEVIDFAKEIRMIALPLRKEKSGYLLNSMLIPFLFSGLDLYVNGISTPEYIDEAWKRGTGAPEGPFEILDVVGLKTALEIVNMYVKVPSFLAPYNFKGMKKLLEEYIAQNKLGKMSGEGFYKYN